MVQMIRPSYDPVGKVWFFDAQEIADQLLPPEVASMEHPRITELARKLPKRYVVADFESCDPLYIADNARRLKKRPIQSFRSLAAGEKRDPTPVPETPAPPPLPPPPPPRPPEPKRLHPALKAANGKKIPWTPEQYETALNMWAQGINGKIIAEHLGLTRVTVSSRMIEHARDVGDKRAVSRLGPGARGGTSEKARALRRQSRKRAREKRYGTTWAAPPS